MANHEVAPLFDSNEPCTTGASLWVCPELADLIEQAAAARSDADRGVDGEATGKSVLEVAATVTFSRVAQG